MFVVALQATKQNLDVLLPKHNIIEQLVTVNGRVDLRDKRLEYELAVAQRVMVFRFLQQKVQAMEDADSLLVELIEDGLLSLILVFTIVMHIVMFNWKYDEEVLEGIDKTF